MFLYFSILFIPSIFYITNLKIDKNFRNFLLFFFCIFLILFIGFGHNSGGDWGNTVIDFYKNADRFEFDRIAFRGDYLYELISYLDFIFFKNFYILTTFWAIIFIFFLYIFLKNYNQVFLGFLISIPYLITVVAMGFFRQGGALSLCIIGLNFLIKKKYLYFYFFIFLAILIHKSSIVFLFLPLIFSNGIKKILLNIILISILVSFLLLFIKEDLIRLFFYYAGDGKYLVSDGAFFRSLINVVPAILFLLLRKKIKLIFPIEYKIFYPFALIQLSLIFLSFNFSTLADRMAIYTAPFHLFVFVNLFCFFNKKFKNLINILILFYFNFYYFLWLTYGSFTAAWFPYKNIIIEYLINFPVIWPLQS